MRPLITRGIRRALASALFTGLFLVGAVHAEVDAKLADLLLQPALHQQQPDNSMILAASLAGTRIVALGEQGTVLLSDDNGQSFRQASAVPVRAQLNNLYFVDDQVGWAVGHAGLILRTDDAGEHWVVQRQDLQADRPLFSVRFINRNEGWAVGLWSLMVHTRDGGRTWENVELPPLPDGGRADLNLFSLFVGPQGSLFIAAERGMVLRSRDAGKSWSYLETGYQGSLWSGVATDDGSLLVGGLRGALYRSSDDGESWSSIRLAQSSSIVSLVSRGQQVYAVGLDGLQLISVDRGNNFKVKRYASAPAMTAIVPAVSGAWVGFAKSGVVTDVAR
ncbi:WD40/YVTN/BNR-like repeat-containing protein [Pseudomonas sp. LRF_L74]|uniref:WD40/YVTN/BNR-like repeat-containing protein n=1 Tax=Pseudomonas sp. LRF_L74 TaxID=3369422 RepID=UPI003F60A14B